VSGLPPAPWLPITFHGRGERTFQPEENSGKEEVTVADLRQRSNTSTFQNQKRRRGQERKRGGSNEPDFSPSPAPPSNSGLPRVRRGGRTHEKGYSLPLSVYAINLCPLQKAGRPMADTWKLDPFVEGEPVDSAPPLKCSLSLIPLFCGSPVLTTTRVFSPVSIPRP